MRFRILTPMYDTFLRVVMKETRIKSRLVTQLNPHDHERILDFGCGTGTLTLMVRKAGPRCSVYGIDIDPQMLGIAEKKARRDGGEVHFIRYNGTLLPFDDGSFDKVVTSLVIHHLSPSEKPRLFRELFRVLKKGGEMHVLDFGIQRSLYARIVTSFLKYLESIGENIQGKIPEYMRLSGFIGIEEMSYENTPVGTLSFYRSKKN
jgi:ubiquinone/menaquinone biosynthesis C-methylase UbiE